MKETNDFEKYNIINIYIIHDDNGKDVNISELYLLDIIKDNFMNNIKNIIKPLYKYNIFLFLLRLSLLLINIFVFIGFLFPKKILTVHIFICIIYLYIIENRIDKKDEENLIIKKGKNIILILILLSIYSILFEKYSIFNLLFNIFKKLNKIN